MRAELTARLQPPAVAKTLCGFDPKVPMNAVTIAIQLIANSGIR
jgi:hypothetical protein